MQEYNGWRNYRTWCIALWIDNDYSSCQYYQERVMELLDEYDSDEDTVRIRLADELKETYESESYDLLKDTGVFSDLMSYVLSHVDWDEIAEHLMN